MYIYVYIYIKHRQTDNCNKLIERQLRKRDVHMAERCSKMEFIIYGEEGYEMVDGVENFKYLGETLDKPDYDWPAKRQNIMLTWSVWESLKTLMRREGAEPKVSAMFYRVVAQTVLIFGSETLVLLAALDWKVEWKYMCFLYISRGNERKGYMKGHGRRLGRK